MKRARLGVSIRIACGAIAGASTIADPVRADEAAPAIVCAQRAETAERLRDEGKLLSSRELLVQCSQASCPPAVRNVCLPWLSDVERRIPTLVFAGRDQAGRDLPDTRIFVDDREIERAAPGRAIPIDPGVHVVRMERAGSAAAREEIVVREGEKNRLVALALEPYASPPKPDASSSSKQIEAAPRVPLGAWLLGGASVAAFSVAAIAGIKGVSDYNDLESRCGSSCPDDQVDAVSTKFLVADVALGVGIAAAAGAVLVVLLRPQGKSMSTALQESAFRVRF